MILPPARPRLTSSAFFERVEQSFGAPARASLLALPFFIGGIPGYYRESMGDPTKNDRGIYDDCIVLVTRNVFAAWNGNTDPSVFRNNIATLQAGIYPCYQFDIHRGSSSYPAICQRKGPVIVRRDGTEKVLKGVSDYRGLCLGNGLWKGDFGANIHRGGVNGTSSLACQTVPPSQWAAFYALAKAEAYRIWGRRWDKETITYALLS
jgi:lysozyme